MLALLAPLASLFGIEAADITDRLKRQAILWAVIGGFAVIALAFILIAINSALTYMVGPVIAPLIIAAAALVIAVAVFVIVHLMDNAEARREAEKKRSAELTALVTTAAITALPMLLRSPLLRKIGIPAGGALAAAFMLSRTKAASHSDED